ncbi:MAG: DUF3987 domain-containing protein [Planctomycetota bacterium]|nr:DUF3987 domain-containing protein [Planctomycetota bacterium]
MGAGNWKPEYADQLKNRKCCIIADNDDPGRRHAEDVARSLHGVAAEVRMLELPGLPVGGDVSDWLDAGGTRDELEKLLERTDEWAPTRAAPNENKPADHAKAEPPTDKTPKQKQKRKRPQVPAFQPFPVDVLPEPLSSFVSVGSKAIGCDASYVALPLLAGLASAIGNTHRIQIKYGWSEPSVLWCVIIGESGSLKSPAIDAALGHIRQRQAKAFSEFKQEMKEYERELEVHNADMSEWKKTGHKNGEPLPLSPDKPTSGRCWCSDTTIEALAQILDNAPRGILVIRDELSGWLRSFDAYKSGKGGDVAHYLEMHRAGHLLVDRKTGDKATISVPRAAVSIIGGIQPETLRRALGEENFENGLAARFLMTMPPRRTKRWRNTTLDRVLEDHLNSVFDWLFSLEAGVDENNEPRPVLVPLSPEGQQAWIRFYDDFAVEQANLTGELAAAMSKLEGCGARLALIVHLVRCATGELNLGDPIDAESVGKGVSLIQWFVHETKRVYAILGETDGDREIRQIVELIQRKGGRISVRDFQRTRSYPSSDDATAELAKLVEAGIGSWESVNPAAGGRPSKHFVLSDTLTTDKTTTHDHANRGFVSCQSVSGDGNNNNDDWGVI